MPSKRGVERPLATWTLYKQLTFSATSAVKGLIDSGVAEMLEYYRFPFPVLPSGAQHKLSKLLAQRGTTESLERDYLQKLVDSWRRSLLHLWESLKIGRTPYFYYLQSDLVVLFCREEEQEDEDEEKREKKKGRSVRLTAYVARATKSLSTQLKHEGIAFEILERTAEELDPATDSSDGSDCDAGELFDGPEQGQENMNIMASENPRDIKAAILHRINRARKVQSKRRSAAPTTLRVTGKVAVHSLIDFIINQRDGRSYVILPELVAPTPFLHGTLCKSEMGVVGPILGGEYQVRLCGTIPPPTAQHFINQIYDLCDGAQPFSMSYALDERTEPLISVPL